VRDYFGLAGLTIQLSTSSLWGRLGGKDGWCWFPGVVLLWARRALLSPHGVSSVNLSHSGPTLGRAGAGCLTSLSPKTGGGGGDGW
jgi:hypothetical protein